ncbi:MAG: HEAT repeat domain-containing protein [Rivularia sp. (in: cyanobacteria)]
MSKSTLPKLLISQLAVALISFSLLPLNTSTASAQQLQEQNSQQAVSTIPKLIEILEQREIYRSSPVAEAAIQQLVNIGKPAVPQLIEAFKKNRAFLTIGLRETLAKIARKDSSVAQILINKLGDKNTRIRLGAMLALNDDSFEAALKKATQDKNPRIRTSAAISLASVDKKSAETVKIIKNGLKDEDIIIRVTSASVLSEINSETASATPILIEALENQDSVIRLIALEQLIKTNKNNSQNLPVIIKAIEDQDSAVRYMAINRISDLEKERKATIPALIKALDDKDGNIRSAAIYALGNMGSDAKTAKPKLVAILQNQQESDENRGSAAMALGEMQKDAASTVPTLINILEDKQITKQLAVSSAIALDKIDSQALIPALVKRLPDKKMEVPSTVMLSSIASKMKENQASFSNDELAKAISEFETALKIIDNSENEIPQDKVELLRQSVGVLKSSTK